MILNSPTRGCRLFVACLSALITVVLISGSGFAQSDSNPKWDAFIGYQYLQADGDNVPVAGSNPNSPGSYAFPEMPKGIGGALTFNFNPHWGLETDFGYSRNTGQAASEWTASAGPRFMVRTDSFNFFVHAMPGFNRVSYDAGVVTHNGIGAILGGGMDIPISKMFSWRLFEADYVWARHNFSNLAGPESPSLRRPTFEGARLRTGIVFNFAGAEAVAPTAACSVQPAEVLVGEPITATVTPSNFNPKHTVTYSWSGNGGQVTGKDTTASIDTTNVVPGSYAVTAHVTDPKAKNNNVASCSANYTVKPLPPKNPPTMSLSASPTSLVAGGAVNLSASCNSPDNVPVSVANWTSSAGTVSGTGNAATLSTAGVPPGSLTVSATCTDSRGLSQQASTQITIENPPPPPVDVQLEARLALHSVYFPTARPTVIDPTGGLLPGQQRILLALATDFTRYLESKPDAHLILEGHADSRGSDELNQALTERRVGSVKNFLVQHGVPQSAIETLAFGKQRNLTTDEVRSSIEQNPDLTTEERKRALARITVVRMASNRRVDVTLKSAGQTEKSVRQFPFNAADALSLIGGRESEKKTAKPAPRKKPVKKP
ncbi:MAG: OmpA family protein [Candidatus Sulfotelmatobacter sp.]|jgi:outer membrane protein OmpA-like peptidoglycan-associated protein